MHVFMFSCMCAEAEAEILECEGDRIQTFKDYLMASATPFGRTPNVP